MPTLAPETSTTEEAEMTDSRVGMRAELHPATDAWMRGDRYGDIVSVSKRTRSFRIRMDRSGKILTVSEGNIAKIFRV